MAERMTPELRRERVMFIGVCVMAGLALWLFLRRKPCVGSRSPGMTINIGPQPQNMNLNRFALPPLQLPGQPFNFQTEFTPGDYAPVFEYGKGTNGCDCGCSATNTPLDTSELTDYYNGVLRGVTDAYAANLESLLPTWIKQYAVTADGSYAYKDV